MAYVLIWLSLAACALSLMALVVAVAARARQAWVVWLVGVPVFLWVLAAAVMPAIVATAFAVLGLENSFAWYFDPLAVVVTVGMATVLWRGRKPLTDGEGIYGTRWPIRRLLGAFIVSFVCAAALMWWSAARAHAGIDRLRIAAVRDVLEVAPAIPNAEDDAANLYGSAFALKGDAQSPLEQEVLETDYTDYGSDEVAEVLAARGEVLAAVREAAKRPRFYIVYPYDRPTIDVMLPSLAPMRHCARLVQLSARHRLAKGDVEGAIDDVRTLAQMTKHVAEPPILVHALVAIGMDAMTIETAAEVLGRVQSGEQLAKLPALEAGEMTPLYARSLKTERAFLLTEMSLLGADRAATAPAMGGLGRVSPLFWIFWLGPEAEAVDPYYARLQTEAVLPYPEASKRIQVSVREAVRKGMLSRILVPSLDRAMGKAKEEDAARLAYGLAVEATRYRMEHGRWPASQAELEGAFVKQWPADPLDLAPMRMKSQGNQVTFYSVGVDLKDDDGRTSVTAKDGGDVTVTVTDTPP